MTDQHRPDDLSEDFEEIPDLEEPDDMDEADTANGEGPMEPANDAERRYGKDESPA